MSKKNWLNRYVNFDGVKEVMPSMGFTGAADSARELQIKYGISYDRAFWLIIINPIIWLGISFASVGPLLCIIESIDDLEYKSYIGVFLFITWIIVFVFLLPLILKRFYHTIGLLPQQPQSRAQQLALKRSIKRKGKSYGQSARILLLMTTLLALTFAILFLYAKNSIQ